MRSRDSAELGSLCLDGTAEEAVRAYLEKAYSLALELPLDQRRDRSGSGVRAASFRILNEQV